MPCVKAKYQPGIFAYHYTGKLHWFSLKYFTAMELLNYILMWILLFKLKLG